MENYDVVIVGAGPAGLGAALMSARCGAKTLVVEQYGLPGGMAVTAEVQPFMVSVFNGRELDSPVYGEWKNAMKPYLAPEVIANIALDPGYGKRSISKEAAALAAEDLMLAQGVEILYHHRLIGATVSNSKIKSLTLHSKGGIINISGKMYIDCTGDGDLAAYSGCRFEIGDGNGICQPMSLCFKLSHVNVEYEIDSFGTKLLSSNWKSRINTLYRQAIETGKIHCPREDILSFPFGLLEEGIVHFNTTRVINYNPLSGSELSKAEQEGRRQLRELLFWLRSDVPGFENCRLLSMGTQIGVRESRRICGIAYLTKDDFERAAKFPDAIARSNYHIDIHSGTGSGTYRQTLPKGEYYEIPYGCIVPKDCNNLTIGGRPISSDVVAHSSLRIMPTAISIGQAAGVASALAAKEQITPAQLSGTKVRQKLIKLGAFLQLLICFLFSTAVAKDYSWSQNNFNLYTVRHGQRAPIVAPDYDPPLTDIGRKQAVFVANELVKLNFNGRIYSSPYRRTLETASIIAKQLKKEVYLLSAIQEFIKITGSPKTKQRNLIELKKEFPLIAKDSAMEFPWLLQGPESLQTVKFRVEKMLNKLTIRNTGEDILLVTHGAVVKGTHLLMIDHNQDEQPNFPMNWNCCLSIYGIENKKVVVKKFFDISFLPTSLVTSNEKKLKSQF